MTPDTATYSLPARVFHWVTAVLVLSLIPLGIAIANMGRGPLQDTLYELHRSIGLLVIPIVVARLLYRMGRPPPPLPADIPPLQHLAASSVHIALYVLLIAQPLIGWASTSAYGAPVSFFWRFTLPPIWPLDRPFSDSLFTLHQYIGFVLAALICLHIAGALYHRFVRRDGVLRRMWA